MSRRRVSDEDKLEHLREQLTLYWRAPIHVLVTRQLVGGSALKIDTLNAFGRKMFAGGRVLDLDGQRVLVTYAKGGWSLLRAP